MKINFIIAAICLFSMSLFAAPVKNQPIEIMQPSGEIINCFISGDEFYNWIHDENDYTILFNEKNKYYCYATMQNEELIPTNIIVGKDSPQKNNLLPGINYNIEKLKTIKEPKIQQTFKKNKANLKSTTVNQTVYNNVVFFVRFAGENNFI